LTSKSIAIKFAIKNWMFEFGVSEPKPDLPIRLGQGDIKKTDPEFKPAYTGESVSELRILQFFI